jgi:arylsulfatase A-like enzyme
MLQMTNILFILIDDLGWRDLSCTGSPFYETPHIDRLAAQGMRFSNAYAACPVCSPSRASILTGRYPARLGLTDWIGAHTQGKLIDAPYVDHLALEEYSLGRALQAGGYQTWHVGKWHLGAEPYYPDRHGFDVNIAGCHWGYPRNGYFSPWGIPTLPDSAPGEYMGDRLTDEAIRLIENRRKDQPFFLNLWYYEVHTPIQAKPHKLARYVQKARDLGLDQQPTFREGEFFPCEHKKDKRVTRRLLQSDPAYAAMIETLDDNIGRLLDTLERQGIAEDTLVIFTSDNGGLATAEGSPTCNLPLAEGKGWMFEGGTREPLLLRYPGVVAPGSVCAVPVTSPDFYPTLLEAASLAPLPQQHCDGLSLLPLLRQSGAIADRPIFWHYPHYGNQGGTPGSSVRWGDYKLIHFFEDDRLELYNLVDDPGESKNLAQDEPAQAKKLYEALVDWRVSVSAKIPQRNPAYRP